MSNLVIDVEATGPHPVEYSLIQIGAYSVNGEEFSVKMRPREGTKCDPKALKAIGVTEEEIMTWPAPEWAMQRFMRFLTEPRRNLRPVWSDNPAFDWQFINAYLHMYCGENPLGFSMRRIGDLYAGHMQDVGASTKWKKLRDTKHTHDALDDAKGNAEALAKILKMIKAKR